MEEKHKNMQVAQISIFITGIFAIFMGVAYAFLNQTLTGTKRQVITAGNLQMTLKEENEVTLENALPMYDEVGMLQKPYEFHIYNKMKNDMNYTLKLKDVTTSTDKLDVSFVRYGLMKDGILMKDYLSNLNDNIIDEGTVEGEQTINYSLRFWIDSNIENENLVKGKTLSYRIEIESTTGASPVETPVLAGERVFSSENLGKNCDTYNDGIDTFLVGQCNQNYVWYSGKLWRVVSKNNADGSLKLVTDNNITVIPNNVSNQSTFANSYVDQWLSQEFLNTLHNAQDFLVTNAVWDATSDASDTPTRPAGTTTVQRTVGLLNSYEYYTVYNRSNGLATNFTNYLNNDTKWWLINPYDNSTVNMVSYGRLLMDMPSFGSGVRPSVNLKSNILLVSGKGTMTSPYRLENDEQDTINGISLLSTRYSGEYVHFNNDLYRIVGVENGRTKITAVDNPIGLEDNKFHSTNDVVNFGQATIKTDLENYYQNNVVEPYKSMIEPNTTWYLGTVGYGENYKASICKTVHNEVSAGTCERTDVLTTASIALPRIGEMFTSGKISRVGTKFVLLNPFNASHVSFLSANDDMQFESPGQLPLGARPSMYLKSNVVISSTNTGDGTYDYPYDIDLANY